MANRDVLLQVEDLKTYFFLNEGTVHAVEGADFEIHRGQTLGVVGESGCGKSVTARSIMRIVAKPGRIVNGKITLYRSLRDDERFSMSEEVDLTSLDPTGKEIRNIRGAEIALVPQEPMTSLSPVHTVGNQIMEAVTLHQGVSQSEAREQVLEMFDRVNMPQPERAIDRYSFQLSGGMRQRAMIAMALSCRPSLLICDEPTTALDVTTEAQILRLMRRMQDEFNMAIMYITHDLGVIAQMAEYVIVMYLGRVVEAAPVDDIFFAAKHPYTQALLRSIPRLDKKTRDELQTISGSVPDPYSIPPGCPFHPRCVLAISGVCDVDEPPYVEVERGHRVRCVRYRE